MSGTDFRAELKALLAAIDLDVIDCNDGERFQSAAARAAKAVNSNPSPEGGPSDDDLAQLLFDDHRGAIEFVCDFEAEGKIMIQSHIEFARAVLARYGTITPPEAQP